MEETKMTKKKIFMISLLVIVAIVLILFKILYKNETNNYTIVTSSSKFYTVSSCVNRYVNYLYTKDDSKILEILDSEYKRKNSINKNNLFNKIQKLDKNYSFEARKMYQEEINENVVKYYVKGYLIENVLSDSLIENGLDFYLIVYLDSKNSTYSVVPYDGKIFLEEEQNEKR